MFTGKNKALTLAAVGVVVIVIAFFFGRPAYHRYREKRTMTQVAAALKKGDYREAMLGLQRVLMINSANQDAVRLRAELSAAAMSPDALYWRQRAIELAPTFDNKILLAVSALRVERPPYPVASRTLAELEQAGAGTNASFHMVAWQLAIAQGQPGLAESHLQVLIRFDPTNRMHQLNLATVHLQSTDKKMVSDARRELAGLTSDQALRVHALRALVTEAIADKRFEEADQFSVRLLALPEVQFDDRLVRLTGLYEAHSKQLSAALNEVKSVAATNVLLIARTADWLNGHGMAADALGWFDTLPIKILATPPLPTVKADSLTALRDWPKLEQYLTKQNWDEQEYIRLALLARSLREQNRREMAGAQWTRAMAAAETRVQSLTGLAQIASNWGWTNEVDEALWAIVRRSPRTDWAWTTLVRNRMIAGDTQGLYRVYNAELQARPDLLQAKNDVASIALLLNTDIPRAVKFAHEVYESQPTNIFFASTYAFALYRQSKPDEALNVMKTLSETDLRRPNIAVYQAVLLAANGQGEKAKPYFEAAQKAMLLPEERRLLAQASAQK